MAPPNATETCTVELHEFSPDHRYHISTLPQASAIASHSRTSISSSKASVQRIPTVTDDKYTISSPRKSGEIGPNDEEITDPSLRSNASGPAELVPEGALAVPVLQTWNNPSINKWRILAAFYSFIVLGMNDSAAGALIPYLETYYSINFTVISLIFLTPFVGYTISALVNDRIHTILGRRGVGIIGSFCHMASYIIMAVHPPCPVLVIVMCFAGFGSGTLDAAWNSYIGVLDRSNEILGLLHGMYGLGAVLSPVIATSMIANGYKWYEFYYVLIGLAAAAVVFSGAAFWGDNAEAYQIANGSHGTANKGGRTRESLKHKVTWLIALFLWIYVGAEVSLGGWIVTFMIKARDGSPFDSGMVSAGFWIGITMGRFTLGWVTGRFGERLMVSIYLVLSIALELVFWLVPQFYVSAVSVALLGFFLGPLFPSAMVVETRLLPQRLHVSALGFATAVGGSGAAIFPFAVGAIAGKAGVQTLQPIVLGLLVAQLGLWLCLPRVPKVHQS